MHAVFDKNAAKNKWSISGSLLKSWAEHFGTTEQLDMYSENGRVVFTSYTEKIMDGKGMCQCFAFCSLDINVTRGLEATIAHIYHARRARFREFHCGGEGTYWNKRQGL